MPARHINVYFGAREEADLYANAQLGQLARANTCVQIRTVLSAATALTARRTGRLHQVLEEDFSALPGAKAYVAGPPPMVAAIGASCGRLGVRPADLHCDPFTPSGEWPTATSAVGSLAKLWTSRRAIAASDRSH